MGDVFKGWRRKCGCLSLLIALALTTGWVRSLERQETIHLCPGQSLFVAVSANGNLGFARCVFETHAVAISKSITIGNSSLKKLNVGWSSELRADLGSQDEWWTGAESEWHWSWHGFRVGSATHTTLSDEHVVSHLQAPYWSIVIPLTLLSAYLILSKPLKTTPQKSPPANPQVEDFAITSI